MLEQLKKIVKEKYLIEKTQESFWKSFNNYRKEESDEFEIILGNYQEEKLRVWLHSVAYKIKNWSEYDYEYIVVRMELEYDNNTIGKYEACFNMDGEYEDDYFVIY